jgi:hypothetical protein
MARKEQGMTTLREAAQQFVTDYENGDLGDLKHYARALRAALEQPEQEPLSDEELDRLWREPMSADWEHREFARAIEAAHGIKENT